MAFHAPPHECGKELSNGLEAIEIIPTCSTYPGRLSGVPVGLFCQRLHRGDHTWPRAGTSLLNDVYCGCDGK